MMKKLTNNLGFKLISVLFAIILWLIVVSIDDPVKPKTFSNIPVTIANEKVITGQGKVYEILEGSSTISVTVRVNRSVSDKLDVSDFVAVADMEQISITEDMGLIPIQVVSTRSGIKAENIAQSSNNVKVSIEELQSKQFAINVNTIGTPANGWAVGTTGTSPNVLKVSGPASVVSKIARVVVETSVEGMNEDIEAAVTPMLFDENDILLDTKHLSFNIGQVTSHVELLKTKKIPLLMDVIGTPADGYKYTGIESDTKEIYVKGSSEKLSGVNHITILSEDLDVTNISDSIEKVLDITKYLPEGIELVDENTADIVVTIQIEPLVTRNFSIPISSIVLKDISQEYDVSFANIMSIEVPIKGLSADLDVLTVDKIQANINGADLKEGTHFVEVTIVVSDKYIVAGTTTLNLILKAKEENTPSSDLEAGTQGGNTAGSNTSGDNSSASENTPQVEHEIETTNNRNR